MVMYSEFETLALVYYKTGRLRQAKSGLGLVALVLVLRLWSESDKFGLFTSL